MFLKVCVYFSDNYNHADYNDRHHDNQYNNPQQNSMNEGGRDGYRDNRRGSRGRGARRGGYDGQRGHGRGYLTNNRDGYKHNYNNGGQKSISQVIIVYFNIS